MKYPILKNGKWLYHQYIILDKTMFEIAKEIGCSDHTVGEWIKKNGIPSLAVVRTTGRKKKEKLRKAFPKGKHPNCKEKIKKICPVCKENFEVVPSANDQECCSTECMRKLKSERYKGEKNHFYGKHHSQKQKDKWSKDRKGKQKGEKSPSYGKHHSQKTRDKMSKAKMGTSNPVLVEWNRQHSGERNHLWRGGISFNPYTLEFNKQLKATIRYRDGYKCQKCGCPEIENNQRLTTHHVDYDKQNCEPFNLISLCRNCNSEVNSNRPYWTKYFTRKIKKIMSSSSLQLHFNYTTQNKRKNCNIVPKNSTYLKERR